ncbi:MAG: hypothetical protein ABEK04_00080 [Candidatus Nanohalobium sp.]
MSVQLTDKVYELEDVAKDILSSPDEAYQKVIEEEDSTEQEVMMDIYDEILDNQNLIDEGENPRRGGLYLATGSLFALSGFSGLLGSDAGAREFGAASGYIAGGLFLLKHGFDDALDFYGEEDREESFEMLGDLTVHQKEGEDVYRVEYDPV